MILKFEKLERQFDTKCGRRYAELFFFLFCRNKDTPKEE